MSQKNILLFALLSVLLLFMVYRMRDDAREAFVSQKEQVSTFEKEAKEIAMLKKRFGDKKGAKNALERLKRIAPPQKEFVKGKSKIVVFDQLDTAKLNALMRKIANSGLVIKHLTITRIDDLHAKVRLELAK
jgi:hypothetical protein